MAENIVVKRIPSKETINFILSIHYARRRPTIQYAFGLFVEKSLVGIVTYGQPASPFLCIGLAGRENKHNVLELNRVAFLPGFNKNNYASMLIGRSLKMLPSHTFVVSYADAGWGHIGYIYQATNFFYTGLTKKRTDIYAGNGKHSRHYTKGETRRTIRTPKHRYVYIVGNKKEKKEMLKELRYPIIHSYPKGETHRYDVNNPVPPLDLEGRV